MLTYRAIYRYSWGDHGPKEIVKAVVERNFLHKDGGFAHVLGWFDKEVRIYADFHQEDGEKLASFQAFMQRMHAKYPPHSSTEVINGNETILEEAHRLVNGTRQQDYSHPYDNFTGIAALWNAAFGWSCTPEQVGLAMILVKINRENFRHGRDNLTDLAGYAQCLDMVDEEKTRRALADDLS